MTDMQSAPKVNILLVDDQVSNLLVLEAALAPLRQNLVKARSGEKALEYLLDEDFAVILMDVQMPGMSGLETAELIRGRDRCRHIPIIFITAFETTNVQIFKGYALGAVDYLFKPIVPQVLQSKVAVFVDLFQKTVELQRQAELLRQNQQREHERKLREERHRWEVERLREEASRKDEFLAMLAHELRNPLSPILNAIQLMRLPGIDRGDLERAQDIIERQTWHMARLIDDLLDVSRISQGRIQLHKEPIDLATAVARAVETTRPLIDARGHQLTVSLDPVPLRVEADPTRLEQIVSNLLHNAAKYTEPKGQIWLTARRDGSELVLQVRDTGVGITAEMLPRVFELFTQAQRSLNRSEGGLGVGLTLVRRLLDLHGGSVHASSPGPGQGSEFIVRLPALDDAPVEIHEPPDSQPKTRVERLHVLVVDDNIDSAESTATLLKVLGHDVRIAHDGRHAAELAAAEVPELVLLDLGLPEIDGYEVARRLRQQPGGDTMLIVAMTGYGSERERNRTQQAGFNHHLVKPISVDALEAVLRAAREEQSVTIEENR